MNKYAFLCGSAPSGFCQKKLNSMYEFILTNDGGAIPEKNVCIFPNGINEMLLECGLNSVFESAAGEGQEASEYSILLYFCTQSPVFNSEEAFFLGNEEIRKDVISYYQSLAEKHGITWQVVFDFDKEWVSEKELGFEKV